ncbi:MAG: phosphonate ABC transporter, permease protein PhnE [Erysipelotrichaceae bacterium]|nr:phosphonate ABC transporter, permease protein PhnE [Erysipelotrichaceae bacterium]
MLEDIIHIFFPRTYTLSNGKEVKEKFNYTPYVTIAVIIITYAALKFCKVDIGYFIRRFDKFAEIVKAMIPPNWSFWSEVKKPMIDTIVMSVLGTAFGCALALPLSFYLSNNFHFNKYYMAFHRGLLSVLRTLPTMVYASLLSVVIGSGALAGTIAIAIFTYTIAVKMLYEQIETIDMGPYEAMESTGAKRVQCMIDTAYPQVRGFFWSTVLYCFETNVRSAAILGYVGAGGIGVIINAQLSWRNYANAGLILFVLVLTVVAIETASRMIRRKLVQG